MASWISLVLVPAIATGALYALIATGFNLLARSTQILNFAHGYLIMWGPLGVLVLLQWHVPVWLAVGGGLLMAVGLGLIEERVAIRPFIASSVTLPWILSTLGAAEILGQLAATPFSGQPEAFSVGFSGAVVVAAIRVPEQDMVLVSSALIVYVVLAYLYRRTQIGRMLTAVGEDYDGARALGISPRRMSQISAGIAAAVAAITGITFAPLTLVDPSVGLQLTFTGFVAAAVGGVGSLEGGMVGGLLVGLVSEVAGVYLGSSWTDTAVFSMLLLVYLVRPWGLLGAAPARSV